MSSRASKSSRRSSSPKQKTAKDGRSSESRTAENPARPENPSNEKGPRLAPKQGSAAAAAVATALQGEAPARHAAPALDLGRCGGRQIRSPLERRVCQALSDAGIAHSHAPRRFEVKIEGERMAAYSPCIVLRGRGREGKTTVIECMGALDPIYAQKVASFHRAYEAEFYVILVASLAVLEELDPSAYDEGILPSELESLIGRIAD